MSSITSIKRFFKNPYFVFYVLAYFGIPLVRSINTQELFEFPKTFTLYFFSIFLLAFFVSDYIIKKFSLVKIPWQILLFIFSFLISTIFSNHLYTSFWGYYSRFNGGLASLISYFIIFYVGISKLSKDEIENIFKFSMFSLIPIGFLGILQYYGLDMSQASRVYSTFGQPNWLAQFLGINVLLSLYYYFKEKNILYLVLYIFGFYCLWITFSLSGLLGFILGFAILVAFFIRKGRFSDIKKNFIIVVVISAFIGLLNLGLYKPKIIDVFNDLKKISQSYFVSYAQDQNLVSDPGYIRFGLWKGSLNLAFSSFKAFLLGTGPETFPYAFQQFRPLSLNYSSEWDYVFNKPHNFYLEILCEQGILGLSSFIILIIYLFKKLPQKHIPGFVSFLITNVFGWPVVSVSMLFWLWLILGQTDER